MNCLNKHRLLADQCGAVAFEMPFVILFIFFSFIIPIADFAVYSYKYISGFQALRDAGQYMQYHPPADVTQSYTLPASVATISGYPITVQLYCGRLVNSCVGSATVASPMYYTFQTSYTISPSTLMKPVLCGSSNPNCTFALTYTERFD